jgi:glutathione S-transferase
LTSARTTKSFRKPKQSNPLFSFPRHPPFGVHQLTPPPNHRLHDDLKAQYSILNSRLSEPGRRWLALKDRPTIADIANYPFADKPTSARMGLDLEEWPALKEWAERVAELEDVKRAYEEMDSRKQIEVN